MWDAIGKTQPTALPPAHFCHPKWPCRLRMRIKWACLHNLGLSHLLLSVGRGRGARVSAENAICSSWL